jgi:hypothetical protein
MSLLRFPIVIVVERMTGDERDVELFVAKLDRMNEESTTITTTTRMGRKE